jgi:hypothetical protein
METGKAKDTPTMPNQLQSKKFPNIKKSPE